MESTVIQSQDLPVRKIQVNLILSLIELYFSYSVLPASSFSVCVIIFYSRSRSRTTRG